MSAYRTTRPAVGFDEWMESDPEAISQEIDAGNNDSGIAALAAIPGNPFKVKPMTPLEALAEAERQAGEPVQELTAEQAADHINQLQAEAAKNRSKLGVAAGE